jgi:nucleoside-diphosphate-sugar epimerase
MAVLIDGATGFIGSNVTKLLVSKGYEVKALGRNPEKLKELKELGAKVIRCDLLDKKQIRDKKIFDNVEKLVHCSGCINLAASWNEMYKGNVETAKNLYEEALNWDLKKIIHLSSVAIYGKQKKNILKEEDPKLPDDDYGKTKWLGHQFALKLFQENGLPVSVLIPAFVYGPGEMTTFYTFLIGAILVGEYRKKKVIINWKRPWHFVSIENIKEGIRFLLEKPNLEGEEFNIADSKSILFSDLWRLCVDILPYPETRFGIFPLAMSNDFFFSIFLRFTSLKENGGKMVRLMDQTLEELRKKYNVLAPRPIITSALGRADKYKKKYALTYDISKILNLGFQPKVKKTEEELRKTINWYIENRWIPKYGK